MRPKRSFEPYARAGLFESIKIRALRPMAPAPEPEPGLVEPELDRSVHRPSPSPKN